MTSGFSRRIASGARLSKAVLCLRIQIMEMPRAIADRHRRARYAGCASGEGAQEKEGAHTELQSRPEPAVARKSVGHLPESRRTGGRAQGIQRSPNAHRGAWTSSLRAVSEMFRPDNATTELALRPLTCSRESPSVLRALQPHERIGPVPPLRRTSGVTDKPRSAARLLTWVRSPPAPVRHQNGAG